MPTTTPSKNTSTKRQRQRTGPSPAHYDFVLVVIVAGIDLMISPSPRQLQVERSVSDVLSVGAANPATNGTATAVASSSLRPVAVNSLRLDSRISSSLW